MKSIIKSISLLIAIATLLSFSACNQNNAEKESDTQLSNDTVDEVTVAESSSASQTEPESETEIETEIQFDLPTANYNTDFHMLIQPDSNHFEYYWVKESGNDLLSEAIYHRQNNIYKHLGVDIIATKALGHAEYDQPFMNSVKNKDGAIDTLQSHSYMAISKLILGGYLIDFNTVSEIDLTADYWELDVMEEVAAKDKLYLGYSDYRLTHTIVIVFNKEMLDKYGDALDESIYDTVRNYRWTLDKMISLANLVYIDQTGDGKTDDDIFGITGSQWFGFTNFLQASNIPLVEMNEKGDYAVSVYNSMYQERTAALVDKLHSLSKSDCSFFRFREEPVRLIGITSGQTLLAIDGNMNLPYYLSSDVEFGVLPLPMYDELQKDVGYRSLDLGGWLCIPSYTDDQTVVAHTLEALAFYSKDVQIAFYEKLLGKQVAAAPDDSQMLDIIWNGVCSDIGLTYSSITSSLNTNLYMLANVTYADTTYALASYVKSYENSANKQLKKFFSILSN